jgi:exopolysaccharide biosynthesis protein
MKSITKIIGILFIVSLLMFIVSRLKTNNSIKIVGNNAQPSPSVTSITKAEEIQFNGTTYAYVYFFVSSSEKIELIPNFSEKMTSSDLASKHGCVKGINGGFYDTNSAPLGGFKSQNKIYKQPVRNRLIDGYLWYKNNQATITLSEPPRDAQFFLQTGPLLMTGGGVTTISIGNDEYRRRSVALLTKDKNLLFLVVYNPESVYEGPLLTDLPAIISSINDQTSLRITEAINLDGGSASAFYSKDKKLQELTPVGSIFCVK